MEPADPAAWAESGASAVSILARKWFLLLASQLRVFLGAAGSYAVTSDWTRLQRDLLQTPQGEDWSPWFELD